MKSLDKLLDLAREARDWRDKHDDDDNDGDDDDDVDTDKEGKDDDKGHKHCDSCACDAPKRSERDKYDSGEVDKEVTVSRVRYDDTDDSDEDDDSDDDEDSDSSDWTDKDFDGLGFTSGEETE